MSLSLRTRAAATIAALLATTLVGVKAWNRFDTNRRCCQLSGAHNALLSAQEMLRLKRSYSQFGQDKWVTEHVFPGVTDGFFLDVGSGDGTIGSNTKMLEQYGWRGICVDPFPHNMEGRTCQMVKEVVFSAAGQTVQFRDAGDLGGIDATLGLWENDAKEAPLVEFTTVTLRDILERGKAPHYIHFFSLDIEGGELAALQAFPFDDYRFGALAVEHNDEEPKRSNIKTLLESHGYERVHSWLRDDFYVPRAPR